MHHNEMHGEKDRLEQYKNATDCFEQILETTLPKPATVRPPASIKQTT